MLESTKVTVSRHALERWKERSGMPDGMMMKIFESSRVAGKKILKRIRESCPAHTDHVRRNMAATKFIYWVNEKHVFVVRVDGVGVFVMVTYWKMD